MTTSADLPELDAEIEALEGAKSSARTEDEREDVRRRACDLEDRLSRARATLEKRNAKIEKRQRELLRCSGLDPRLNDFYRERGLPARPEGLATWPYDFGTLQVGGDCTRPRGAGRPRVRRVGRSSAASGDSGDSGEDGPGLGSGLDAPRLLVVYGRDAGSMAANRALERFLGGGREGDDPPRSLPRFSFDDFHRLTPNLTGPERLELFGELPEAQQRAYWASLARALEEARRRA